MVKKQNLLQAQNSRGVASGKDQETLMAIGKQLNESDYDSMIYCIHRMLDKVSITDQFIDVLYSFGLKKLAKQKQAEHTK